MRKIILTTMALGALITGTAVLPAQAAETSGAATATTAVVPAVVESAEATYPVPESDTRFWSGYGYNGGGICIENRTEWQTWLARAQSVSDLMNNATYWYSKVRDGIGGCSGVPAQYIIKLYRYSDSSDGRCISSDYSVGWSTSLNKYYYAGSITAWLNTAAPSCGIVPSNTSLQGDAMSTLLMSLAGCLQWHGDDTYSVLNVDRGDVHWPTGNDRGPGNNNCLDRVYNP